MQDVENCVRDPNSMIRSCNERNLPKREKFTTWRTVCCSRYNTWYHGGGKKSEGNFQFCRLQRYSCLYYCSGWISRVQMGAVLRIKSERTIRVSRGTPASSSTFYGGIRVLDERYGCLSTQGFRVVCQNPWLCLTYPSTYLPTYLQITLLSLSLSLSLSFPCSFEFVTTVDVAATRDPVKSFDFVAKTTVCIAKF